MGQDLTPRPEVPEALPVPAESRLERKLAQDAMLG